MSNTGHSLAGGGKSYSSAEIHSLYSIDSAESLFQRRVTRDEGGHAVAASIS